MIHLENITKTFSTGNSALNDISFSINQGEFVFITGPSGSGKTTLFRMLIKDVIPTSGRITIGEWDITRLPKSKIPHLRKRIGVVFQDIKLLRDRTIAENILFPLEVARVNHKTAKQKLEEILEQVGIFEHKDKFPIQLSGGELQRAAIARALVFSPDIIIADEPTGNLDNATSWGIVKLLQEINKTGTTILMATHSFDIISRLPERVLVLEKGKLTKDEKRKKEAKK